MAMDQSNRADGSTFQRHQNIWGDRRDHAIEYQYLLFVNIIVYC
jgi:hypothetical protein